MAEYTQNLKLKKPSQDDFYNVDDFNANFEILDTETAKRLKRPSGIAEGEFLTLGNDGELKGTGVSSEDIPDTSGMASHLQDQNNPHKVTAAQVGAAEAGHTHAYADENHSHGEYLSKQGGTMEGQLVAYNNTNYTTAQVRNIIVQSTVPSSIANGVIVGVYES